MLAVAGFVSVLFARLGWPKVIGYILAGVLLSRHTWGGSFLVDEASIRTIGQLGVIFLMFSLGLGFSASEMKRIRGVALPTAVLDTVLMTWVGYTVGTNVLGWGLVPSLFLGAAICDSSTTLLAKVMEEMKWTDRPFTKYVLGTSVCEDIICVGIIALVSGVASGGGVSVLAMGMSLGGLVVFFFATLVFGLMVVPRLLDSVAKRHDDEALLLTLLGCCLFVTWIAYKLEFSIALGAFLVGILGASSDVRRRLHALAAPLRSLFAAVFFVSVGLLVNPFACFANLGTILLLSGIVVVCKGANCIAGGLACGESVKTSVQMGFSLAQIGEFAYMVALLYVTLTHDAESPMYQVVVGVSLVTTMANPAMIRVSDRVGDWAERRCPPRLKAAFESYRKFVLKLRAGGSGATAARKAAKRCVAHLVAVAVLEFAAVTAIGMLPRVDYSMVSTFFERHDKFFASLIANVFMLAMFAPVLRIARRLGMALSAILVARGDTRWHQAVRNMVRLVAYVAVTAAFFLEWAMLSLTVASGEPWACWIILALLAVIAAFGWRFFMKASRRAATRLEEALAADERLARREQDVTVTIPAGTVHRIVLAEGSPAAGKSVVELNVRAKTGASVVSVVRNGETTRNIGPDWTFAVGDVLVAMGDDAQIAALRELVGGAK